MTDVPAAWAAGLAARRAAFALDDPGLCVRLLHGEDAGMRCDRFGQVCWFYRYAPDEPDANALARCAAFTAAAGARHWHLHGMHDRGRDPGAGWHRCGDGAPSSWHAEELGLRYELRAGSGQSPGLFLDQRDNRQWVRRHAAGARVLNLFAYTGGFGVAALAGGAAQVMQVDVHAPYLDWARRNAALNGVDDDRTEYAAVDARLLLDGCRRRGRRFDGVVVDPPSFGRGRGRRAPVFRVERDLADLVGAAVGLLDGGGWMLVSSNYEGWTSARLRAVLADVGAAAGAAVEPAPGAGVDFVAGGAEPLLKSWLLRRA